MVRGEESVQKPHLSYLEGLLRAKLELAAAIRKIKVTCTTLNDFAALHAAYYAARILLAV